MTDSPSATRHLLGDREPALLEPVRHARRRLLEDRARPQLRAAEPRRLQPRLVRRVLVVDAEVQVDATAPLPEQRVAEEVLRARDQRLEEGADLPAARAGNRRFWCLSALRAHTKAP
jgi:hypothetical protein